MKYVEQLQKKKIFDLDYVKSLTGNEMTAKHILQSYKKAGYIKSIRRNLYVALDLASKNLLASRFEIGSQINESAYISFHSALEYYGVANQVYYKVTVSSDERFRSFEYNGITYEACRSRIHQGILSPQQTPLVSVTDIERTVVDCIYDIDLAGGLEEILESLSLIPSLNAAKLIMYLENYNQIFLWQKVGFLLENYKDMLKISNDFFTVCRNHIHDHKQYLEYDENMVYYPEWKLYVTQKVINLIKGEGAPLV